MGWQGLAGLFFLSDGGGTSIQLQRAAGALVSEGPAGLDVPDGSSRLQGEVAMANQSSEGLGAALAQPHFSRILLVKESQGSLELRELGAG